jgi:hypothetical protein
MCKYTTLSLSATRCTLLHAGAAAHVYTKYTYYLCHAAHANRPCGNQFPEEEQIGSDVGSRQGACPTCEQLSAAEAEYKLAVQRATDVYTDSVNLAWQRLQDGRGSADYVAEVVG